MSSNYPYSETDQESWRRFFVAMESMWTGHADLFHPWYLNNVSRLLPFRERIPNLDELNLVLAPIAWKAQYVDGLAPAWQIAELLNRQIMPVARTIRPADQVFFANEPDIIHDIFGHLPCLFEADYRQLLKAWTVEASHQTITDLDRVNYHLNRHIARSQGHLSPETASSLEAAARALENFTEQSPSPTMLWEKVYFWIFEFGLVKTREKVQVLGAGLITSIRELERLARGNVRLKELDRDTLLASYHISSEQDLYHTMPSLRECEDLFQSVKLRLSHSLKLGEFAHG